MDQFSNPNGESLEMVAPQPGRGFLFNNYPIADRENF